MTKYKAYVEKMLEANKELFETFKRLHDEYILNPNKWQEEFNREGEKVLEVIGDYENRLCLQSEKAGYAKFTTTLSEKFRAEIKKHFPMVDHIGLKIDDPPRQSPTPQIPQFEKKPSEPDTFTLKRIKLF